MTPRPGSAPEQMTTWLTAGDGIDRLHATTTTVPRPGPTEMLVKVAVVSLNYRDLLVINGVDGWRPVTPVTPVSDAVGHVVAVGDQVTRFQRGDRVLPTFLPKWHDGPLTPENYVLPVGGPVNRGVLSEYVVIDQDEAVHAPRTLSDTEAATLPVAPSPPGTRSVAAARSHPGTVYSSTAPAGSPCSRCSSPARSAPRCSSPQAATPSSPRPGPSARPQA